jgi:hypothetical protein
VIPPVRAGSPGGAAGVALSHPTDYWARVNAEAVDEDGHTPRDQLVLRLIGDAKSNADPSRIVARQVNLSSDDLRALATLLFARLLDRYGAAADADATPGYFAPLAVPAGKAQWPQPRDFATGRNPQGAGGKPSLCRRAVLLLASPRAGLLGHDERTLVLRDMLEAAKAEFAESRRLLSVLDPSDPASI